MSQSGTRSFQREIVTPILRCPPNDKKCWGPATWKGLDTVCDLIPCDTCREHCHRMISFEHDVVNAHVGRPLYNEPATMTYLENITKTLTKIPILVR